LPIWAELFGVAGAPPEYGEVFVRRPSPRFLDVFAGAQVEMLAD
jgi:hypothetical protein